MIYGNVNRFLSLVDKEWKDKFSHISKDFEERKKELVIEFNNRLKKEKELLKKEFESRFKKEKENMLMAFKLKKLQEIENVKLDLIDDLIQRVKDRIHKDKLKKGRLYERVLVSLIKKGIKELKTKNIVIELSKDDCYLKKKILSEFKNVEIRCSNETYDGVVISSKKGDKYVDNRINEICKDKYDYLYSIVDSEIRWEK